MCRKASSPGAGCHGCDAPGSCRSSQDRSYGCFDARRLRVDQDDNGNMTTGMRQEIRSPWNGLLRWRFGVGKSRVEARVVPQDDRTARLGFKFFIVERTDSSIRGKMPRRRCPERRERNSTHQERASNLFKHHAIVIYLRPHRQDPTQIALPSDRGCADRYQRIFAA